MRHRETETQRYREPHIYRQADRVANTHPYIYTKKRHTGRQMQTHIHTKRVSHTYMQAYINTDRRAKRQIYIQTGIHTYTQATIHKERGRGRHTDRQSYIHKFRHTDIHNARADNTASHT